MSSSITSLLLKTLFILTVFTLAACQKQEAATVEAIIPSVKYIEAEPQTFGQTRHFSGQIAASEKVSLSFGISGQVNQLQVEVGGQVVTGQLIAELDQRSYKLKLDSSLSKLQSTRTQLSTANNELDRMKTLFAKKLVSEVEYEQSKALVDNTESQLIVAQNDVNQAKEDLDKTVMRAPFDAVVSQRYVDRLAEVSVNSEIVELSSEQNFQITVLVPASLIRFIQHQQLVTVSLPTHKNQTFNAQVNEIAATSDSGNAYAVTAQIVKADASTIRTGMSAQVSFFFGNETNASVFLIPISAISTRDAVVSEKNQTEGAIPIYVIDAVTSTAKLVWAKSGQSVGNELEIISGLTAGDKVIVAGVVFVKDGMSVTPWQLK